MTNAGSPANPPYLDTALRFVRDLYAVWQNKPADAVAFYTEDASSKFAQESDALAEDVVGPAIRDFYTQGSFRPARVDIAAYDHMVVMDSPPAPGSSAGADGPAESAGDDSRIPYALLLNVHGHIRISDAPVRRRFVHTLALQRTADGNAYRINNDILRIVNPPRSSKQSVPDAAVPAPVSASVVEPERASIQNGAGAATASHAEKPKTDVVATPPTVAEPAPVQPAPVQPPEVPKKEPTKAVETQGAVAPAAAHPKASEAGAKAASAPAATPAAPKSWAAVLTRSDSAKPAPVAPVSSAPAASAPRSAPAPGAAASASASASAAKPATQNTGKNAPGSAAKSSEETGRGRAGGSAAQSSGAVSGSGGSGGREEPEVFVKGLQKPATGDALKRLFEDAVGPVVSVTLPFPGVRDFGYIEFAKLDDARKAIQMGSIVFQGRAIKIEAKRARERSRGRGTGGGNKDGKKNGSASSRRKEAQELPAEDQE